MHLSYASHWSCIFDLDLVVQGRRRGGSSFEWGFISLPLVFLEFESLPINSEDPVYRKYLGEQAKVKLRSLNDVLKGLSQLCDQQTQVDEFNVLVQDKKRLHAIVTVLQAWRRTGCGAGVSFSNTFTEMAKYLSLPPVVEVKWPIVITQNHYEALRYLSCKRT